MLLGQRLRRFRVEDVLLSNLRSRSLRIQAPTFNALHTVSISSNFSQSQSYSTSSHCASRGVTAVKQNEEIPAKNAGEASANSGGHTPTADGTDLAKYYAEYFYSPSNQNAYDIRSGSYMDVDEKDILRYFPEGLAGETDEEFQYSNKKRWMIRDSTKVLFRIIEETEKRLKYDPQEALDKNVKKSKAPSDLLSADPVAAPPKVEGVGLHSAVRIPRLEGQAEWPDSQLRVSYFGQDLFPTDEVSSEEMGGFVKTKGPGSPLEQTIDALNAAAKKDKKESIPDRIVLSGKFRFLFSFPFFFLFCFLFLRFCFVCVVYFAY